jgi:membrane dipeptidase
MIKKLGAGPIALLTLVLTAGCGGAPPSTVDAPPLDPATEAQRLAQELLILDTHIDLPYRLHEHPADVTVETSDGHFDLVRARRGGLDAAFMSIYVPASMQEEGGGRAMADGLIDLVEGIAEQAPTSFAIARSPAEVRELFAQGVFALPLGIENGAAIEDDLGALQHFYERGVRYITLTHSEPNLICDSSYAEERPWGGLSPFGREVVAEMNRLGIMVDVSHLTDDAAQQAIELSRAPVIASHSCARHFTPGLERNIPDELITRIAAGGGVVQIAFAPGFLSEAAQRQSSELWAVMRAFTKETGAAWGSPEFRARVDRFYAENPKAETGVADVADHIEHVIALVGVDHVGLGSDFDGISDTPAGLEDVSGYPRLLEELLRRGLGEQDLRKVCGENLLRVWTEVERVAAGMQGGA